MLLAAGRCGAAANGATGTCGAAGRPAKASVRARGQAPSTAGTGAANGPGTCCGGAAATGTCGANKPERAEGTSIFGCGVSSGCFDPPRSVLTLEINSCGWNGLRINSSAFTATALSATLLFTTPDIKMTGVPLNRACSLIWLQTE